MSIEHVFGVCGFTWFNVTSLSAHLDLETKKPPIREAFLFVLAQQQKFVVETSGI